MLACLRSTAARYVGVWLIINGLFPFIPILYMWLMANQVSESKKGLGLIIFATIGQCGPLLGTHLFPAKEKPYYVKGTATSAALLLFGVIVSVGLSFRFWRINRSRDREDAVMAQSDNNAAGAAPEVKRPSGSEVDEERRAGVGETATGSVIAEILMERYPTYAFTIMVVSYLVLGIGLPLALLILVLYFQRLLLFKSPPRDVIVSVFLPLGPCGQGGEACLHLGRVALHLFPNISQPSPPSGIPQLYSVGQALYGAGLISAMLLFGLGIWWLAIGLFTIIRKLKRGKLKFNMGWWGLTFLFASLAVCTARLAIELDSLALKVTYTVFAIANLLLWAGVAIPTVRGGWNGRLFNAPCLADLPLKP
ncbi:hypothetical protein NDA13_005627 [Ustilago tritici]|nr:hypothetical protein NDA13_005627 [Ustilago tritici]